MKFRRTLIVGKFAPPHRGHQHLIEAALAQAQRVTVLCYAVPDFAAMLSERRAHWLRELYPGIDVFTPNDAPPDDAGNDVQQAFVRQWLAANGVAVDAVFTSESYGKHSPTSWAHTSRIPRSTSPDTASRLAPA